MFLVLRALAGPVLMGKWEKKGGFVFSMGTESSCAKLLSPTEEGYGPGWGHSGVLASRRAMLLLFFPCPPPTPAGWGCLPGGFQVEAEITEQ